MQKCENCRWFRDIDFFGNTLYGFPGDIDKVRIACGINERNFDPTFGIITGTHKPIEYPFIEKGHHCGEWEAVDETK